jgi:threonine/homoserine/homoserine lactone efflux protein
VITFILILLLIAAVFGILGAVLKIALVLVLAVVLAATLLAWGGWLWFRRRIRAFEEKAAGSGPDRRSFDVRHVPNEANREPPGLDG